jgi:hypothetical protein
MPNNSNRHHSAISTTPIQGVPNQACESTPKDFSPVSVLFNGRYPSREITAHNLVTILVILDADAFTVRWREANGSWQQETRSNGLHLVVIAPGVEHSVEYSRLAKRLTLLVHPKYMRESTDSDFSGVVFGDAAWIGWADRMILTLAYEFSPQCAGEISPCPQYDIYAAGVLARRIFKAFGGNNPP